MKVIKLVILFFCLFSSFIFAQNNEIDSLLKVYDGLLENYQIQIDERQHRIDSLRILKSKHLSSLSDQYQYNQLLYTEFRPYISDSAITYLNRNILLAKELADDKKYYDSKLKLAYLLASIGLYKESVDELDAIKEENLPPDLLKNYYNCMVHTYGELSFYSKESESSIRYRDISNHYKDLFKSILNKTDDEYLDIEESDFRNIRDFKMALQINEERLNSSTIDSPKYALIAFFRSLTYKESGDIRLQQLWLLKSAITDVKLGITDNASSWELANLLFKMGDIKRAHQYINYSINNSTIYNARLRYSQIAEIQSIINNVYLENRTQQERKLHTLLVFISILTLLLLMSGIGILFQNRRVTKANSETKKINDRLNLLNWELSQINDKLKNTNAELSESNQVKEEYIGHFLSLCSLYIDKMDLYRKNVRKSLMSGKQATVIEEAKSTDFLDKELREFYENFDRSFLRLYPDFVTEFNNLLIEDEQIVLKKDELLNTELRIFALIRLGIDNSAKIAELLHYSANTIYNYRAKIKNKAKVSRNEFEDSVKKIGTFTK